MQFLPAQLTQGLIAKPDHLCCFPLAHAENIFRWCAVGAVLIYGACSKKNIRSFDPKLSRNFECGNALGESCHLDARVDERRSHIQNMDVAEGGFVPPG
jgi:hypothetical protein